MAEGVYYHKSLRNPNINYRSGWWSVSIQVAKNKSIFGAIVGDKVVLNELGRAVAAVSALCGGAPAGVRVRHGEQRRLPLLIQVLPKSPRSGLLTPEGAVKRIAREFPGSRLTKWVWPSDNNNNDKE